MRAWGFSVTKSPSGPIVVGVEAVAEEGAAVKVGRKFELPASPDDALAEQLRRLMDAVTTALAHDPPDVVVFRGLDYSKFRAEATTRIHALAEGVILAVGHRAVGSALSLPPVKLAQRCNTEKTRLDAYADETFGKGFSECGAAALAGLGIDLGR